MFSRLSKPRLRESIYLTVREGLNGVIIDRVDSPAYLRTVQPIGLRLPCRRFEESVDRLSAGGRTGGGPCAAFLDPADPSYRGRLSARKP